MLLSDGFQESCCYMSLTGKRLPVPSQSKNDQSIEQLVSCWKQENLCWFNVLPVLPIDVTFMQQSSSYRSPAPNREHTHTYRCQPLTTVREPFSSHFPCPQRVRSMTSVTFTRKLRKLESGRNLRPCFGKSFSC